MEQKEKDHAETSLKGTFASVMLLAAFLILTWVGVFVLFAVRG
ncbi:cytochrome c oxidase subunit 2A [Paenibacillus doosanensis]|nr:MULTISPECIES: cytochrome c oxidase subunit 2A [Paenibacillus]MCS7458887.1 cytochrome c oxidase subunit 2A [Paenibacillus doosanensis]